METININEITISPDRQRQYFDEMKLVDLADDIVENGLLHAPVLHGLSTELVVGERRYRAIQMIYKQGRTFEYDGEEVAPPFLPITRISARDALALFEAELSENVQRENLSWQEHAAATARLHEFRNQQKGGGQTATDTASEILGDKAHGYQVTEVSKDITLAKHLSDPEVQKAKSKGEAIKIVQRKLAKERNKELADSFQRVSLSSRYQLIHGECITQMEKLEANQFDVILTDPPYGIGADTFGDQTFIDHEYDDSFETWVPLMKQYAKHCLRTAKSQAHAYVFCDIRRFDCLKEIFAEAGWYVWDTPLIWYKGNMGTLPRPDHGPRKCYEAILYAIKGDKKTQHVGAHDVLDFPGVAKDRHAAEKPVDLYIELLKRSIVPGDTVFDGFVGSGTLFPAAHATQCKAVGIELVDENIGICAERIKELLSE